MKHVEYKSLPVSEISTLKDLGPEGWIPSVIVPTKEGSVLLLWREKPAKRKSEPKDGFVHSILTNWLAGFSEGTYEERKQKTDFASYWLERGHNGKKARWEKEKVFDIDRRFATWMSRNRERTEERKPQRCVV